MSTHASLLLLLLLLLVWHGAQAAPSPVTAGLFGPAFGYNACCGEPELVLDTDTCVAAEVLFTWDGGKVGKALRIEQDQATGEWLLNVYRDAACSDRIGFAAQMIDGSPTCTLWRSPGFDEFAAVPMASIVYNHVPFYSIMMQQRGTSDTLPMMHRQRRYAAGSSSSSSSSSSTWSDVPNVDWVDPVMTCLYGKHGTVNVTLASSAGLAFIDADPTQLCCQAPQATIGWTSRTEPSCVDARGTYDGFEFSSVRFTPNPDPWPIAAVVDVFADVSCAGASVRALESTDICASGMTLHGKSYQSFGAEMFGDEIWDCV